MVPSDVLPKDAIVNGVEVNIFVIRGLPMWPIEKFDGHCELVYKSRLSWKCVVHPIKTEMETCPSFSEGNVETLRQSIPYSEKTATQFAKNVQSVYSNTQFLNSQPMEVDAKAFLKMASSLDSCSSKSCSGGPPYVLNNVM